MDSQTPITSLHPDTIATKNLTTTSSRAAACWRNQDCKSCTHDKHNCGWCPYSSSCIPASSLLDPIFSSSSSHKKNKNKHKNNFACPLPSEHYELRTATLGCGCSTTTLLSVVVTVFATIATLVLLVAIGWFLKHLNPFFGSGVIAGTEIEVKEGGQREEHEWYRPGLGSKVREWWNSKADLSNRSEQEAVTERTRLLG